MSEGYAVVTGCKCAKCGKIATLQKYSYGILYWMFCNSCYTNATTKVSAYFSHTQKEEK